MEKIEERKILLKRFFWENKKLYNIGKRVGLDWFNQFDEELSLRGYVYFDPKKEEEAIERIASSVSDQQLIDIFRELGPATFTIDRFRGEHYSFDEGSGLELVNKQEEVRKDIRRALKETGGRGYTFLMAIIKLYEEGRWKWGGADWTYILSKSRDVGGECVAPRDFPILKSYRIYYKTGSNRYPTHTIPIEIIPIVKDECEKWKKEFEWWKEKIVLENENTWG